MLSRGAGDFLIHFARQDVASTNLSKSPKSSHKPSGPSKVKPKTRITHSATSMPCYGVSFVLRTTGKIISGSMMVPKSFKEKAMRDPSRVHQTCMSKIVQNPVSVVSAILVGPRRMETEGGRKNRSTDLPRWVVEAVYV